MPISSQPSDHRARQRQGLEIPRGLCRRCVRALSRRLRDLPGVVSFEIDASAGRVWINGDVDPVVAQEAVRDLSEMTARATCADGCTHATPAVHGMESAVTTTPTTPTSNDQRATGPSRRKPELRGRIGWVVAASLATGLVAALVRVAVPFVPGEESAVTGAVLCGFALGWAMLAVLSVRFTHQPQRWAAVPALLMGLGGLLLIALGTSVREVLDWVWPPVMLALAVWMIVRVHRQLRSRSGRWLIYSVITLLALASIGGGYETVRETADAKAYPPPGQLIDVGGHRLHLSCTGS